MKLINAIIAGVILTLLLQSCQNSVGGKQIGKVSGYEYEVITDASGPSGTVGEYTYFDMSIYNDKDSLLQAYRDEVNRPAIKLLDETDPIRKKNPLLDVLAVMSVGDSAVLFIPRDSMQAIPPGMGDMKHIEYHLVVRDILTEEEHTARIDKIKAEAAAKAEALSARVPEIETFTEQVVKDYRKDKLDVKETPLGTKYIIHELGQGAMPSKGNMLTMQYYGRTVKDGNRFDDSFSRGRAFPFRLGQGSVIKGWDDAMQYLPVGTKASLFIPSELGYGKAGSGANIPGDAELYFYVEVEDLTL